MGQEQAKHRRYIFGRKESTDDWVPVNVDEFGNVLVIGAGVPTSSNVTIADRDNPQQRTTVDAEGRLTIANEYLLDDTFTDRVRTQGRMYALLAGLVADTEEMRYDIVQSSGVTNDIYVGAATDGALTADAVWDVVRVYFTSGLPVRKRLRTGIAWDSRTAGW